MSHERFIQINDLRAQVFPDADLRDDSARHHHRHHRRQFQGDMDGHTTVQSGQHWTQDENGNLQPAGSRRRWHPDHRRSQSGDQFDGFENGIQRRQCMTNQEHSQFPSHQNGNLQRQILRMLAGGSSGIQFSMPGGMQEQSWRNQDFPSQPHCRIPGQVPGQQRRQVRWAPEPGEYDLANGNQPWNQPQWNQPQWNQPQWNPGAERWNPPQANGMFMFDVGGMQIGVSIGGNGEPRIFLGGNSNPYYPQRPDMYPGNQGDQGGWYIDPETGQPCMNGSGMNVSTRPRHFSPRMQHILDRARIPFNPRPPFVRDNCPPCEQGDFQPGRPRRIPGQPPIYEPEYQPEYEPEYQPEERPRPTGPSGYDYSGLPERPNIPNVPLPYDPRREEPVRARRRSKEPVERAPRPGDRHARQGDDSPADPQSFARMEQIARSLEGHVITEFDRTVPPELGCARGVTVLLKETYNLPFKAATTDGLHQELIRFGFEEVPWEQRRAGDVIIAHREAGKKSHAAVYFGHGEIYNNSSPKGYITTESEQKLYNRDYKEMVVYRKKR